MPPRTHALVPAHNEQDSIAATLASLLKQGVEPADILVICDNCTDQTQQTAENVGVPTMRTVENRHKKAGALNQALRELLPHLSDSDSVLVMDADSILDPGFVSNARFRMAYDRRLGGISGTFRGGSGGGYVGMLQRNEYSRYGRDVRRLRGKALVLTGTATALRVSALRDVIAARQDGRLPSVGFVYDEKVLTEDNELTLALMTLGWRILAPKNCTLTTEVMPTWRDLAKQRLRWKRGALENLWDYGFTRVTWRYWGRQLLSLVSVTATALYLTVLAWSIASGSFHWQPFWVIVTGIFILERAVSVRDRGWRQQLVGATLILEFPYDVWLQGVQAWAFLQVALRRKAKW